MVSCVACAAIAKEEAGEKAIVTCVDYGILPGTEADWVRASLRGATMVKAMRALHPDSGLAAVSIENPNTSSAEPEPIDARSASARKIGTPFVNPLR